MKRTTLFLYTTLAIGVLWMGCTKDSTQPACGLCPNNTQCMGGICGCPDDMIPMGAWCMPKQPDLFVARPPHSCPCYEPFGMRFRTLGALRAMPEFSEVEVWGDHHFFRRQGPVSVNSVSGLYFFYRRLPDGDEILSGPFFLPLVPGVDIILSRCNISDTTRCQSLLKGRFQGPDTIQAQITWWNCTDPTNGNATTTYSDTCRFLMVRQ